MRSSVATGIAFIALGLVMIFLLRNMLISLILLAMGLVGLIVGFALLVIGAGLVFGGWWIDRHSLELHPALQPWLRPYAVRVRRFGVGCGQ